MRVYVITFHFVNNFGGALQAYAIRRSIEKECAAETEILDYRNTFVRFTDTVRLFPVTGNIGEIFSGFKTFPQRLGRIRKFQSFQKNHMNLTPLRYAAKGLRKNPPRADAFICGSDQIWNTTITFGADGRYFLDFVPKNAKKISYAPSFGNSQLAERFGKKIKEQLNNFDALSVREESGVEIIRNLTGRKAHQLIDPVFLLDKEEWTGLAGQCENESDSKIKKKLPERYILLYIMQPDESVYRCAEKIKKRLGLPIVEISRYGYNPGFVDVTLVDAGPAEFLTLFYGAGYICTNSYHGFAFSLIFEKNFSLIPSKRFSDRAYSLADMFGITVNTDNDAADEIKYDRNHIRSVILNEKEKAFDYLRKNIAEDPR